MLASLLRSLSYLYPVYLFSTIHIEQNNFDAEVVNIAGRPPCYVCRLMVIVQTGDCRGYSVVARALQFS